MLNKHLEYLQMTKPLPVRPVRPVVYQGYAPVTAKFLSLKSRGMGWPKFGHQAEMKSLVYHVTRREGLRSDLPTFTAYAHIMANVQREYEPAKWEIPEDFFTFSHFQRAVNQLDWTSSPGYPWMNQAPTNSILFRVKDGVPDPARIEEMWQFCLMQVSQRMSDPIRLFIKPEPHSQEKLRNHRYRLISSVSVLDQLIDYMLFGEMNEKIIENCLDVPCKGGWSVFNGGWKMAPVGGVMALDKSGWDWSAKGWLFEMELDLRTRLCTNMTAQWKDLARWRYRCLFENPIFITSGGMMMRQKEPGVMKSGCFNTLTSNSIMQSLLHHRVCKELDIEPGWLWSLGDDTLQQSVEEVELYIEKMSEYCHVKHAVSRAEFAGVRFERGGYVEPLYPAKHAFNLLHMDPDNKENMAWSYDLLYHRSHDTEILQRVLSENVALRPRDELDAIWDGD